MRKLLNTLFVSTPDTYLSLEGDTVIVSKEGEQLLRAPLLNLEAITTFGYTGASPALMGACAKNNISLSFMSAHGRFLARVTGEIRGNVLLRKKQYRLSDDEAQSLEIAKPMVAAKLYNCKNVISRAIRDHAMILDTQRLSLVAKDILDSARATANCQTLEELRGVEGDAARSYFSVFDDLILHQKPEFSFNGRNRRPPLDRVNALLSFFYSLLAGDVAAALETVGLDPYVGFLHRDRPGRISLALDLMEELRPVIADRFVLSLVNRRQVTPKDFVVQENGAVYIDPEARKRILVSWRERKSEIITHPYLQDKVPWGLIPYVQALLLARFMRDDTDAYPPFLWK